MSNTEVTTPKERPNRDITLLAPFVQVRLERAVQECHEKGYPVAVFEGYRSPSRQEYLYEQGRTTPGKKVTNAKPWESFHQYSLAADVTFYESSKKWYWPKASDPVWDKIQGIFEDHGFEGVSWEKAHMQITRGLTYREAYRIMKDQGLLAVWDVVEKRLKREALDK